MDFNKFFTIYVFRSRNPLLTFLLSYHVWVTSKIQVNFRFERYWGLCLINFWNFHTIHVFEVRKSISDIFTELPWKSRSTSGSRVPQRYWWLYRMNFHNFFTIYVFKVKESIADISTELPCLGDLKNLGQLPSDSRVTQRYRWLYLMDFHNIFTIYVVNVKESIADIPIELSCLSDLENPSQLPVREVLVILSYKFLKFSHYSCFRVQGIHCWYFYRATMFGWPRKSR